MAVLSSPGEGSGSDSESSSTSSPSSTSTLSPKAVGTATVGSFGVVSRLCAMRVRCRFWLPFLYRG